MLSVLDCSGVAESQFGPSQRSASAATGTATVMSLTARAIVATTAGPLSVTEQHGNTAGFFQSFQQGIGSVEILSWSGAIEPNRAFTMTYLR